MADREDSSLKITDGSVASGDATTAGTATAVFDIYLDAQHTPETYRDYLLEQNVGAKSETITVDGYDIVVLAYEGAAFVGPQEAAFIPDWNIQIVYRAAFPNDATAFHAGRPSFRQALGSLTFRGSPGT